MKSTIRLSLAALWALCSAVSATPDLTINTFADESEPRFQKWWGDALLSTNDLTFDGGYDADSDASSGSMKVTVNFTDSGNQWSVVKYMSVFDATKYQSIEMDILFEAGSAVNTNGSFGYLEFGFADIDYGQIYAFRGDIPASAATAWYHISAPIPLTANKIDKVRGIHFKTWGGTAGDTNKLRGPSSFWVDNIRLIGVPDNTPEPVPEISSAWAAPAGLKMVAAGTGTYDRQNIRTATRDFSWRNRGAPVTYALTIADYPSVADFQVHFYLVPGPDTDTGMSYPDYGMEDCVYAQIGGNGSGGGYMSLRYKVNAANSNGVAGHQFWDADDGINGGTIASVGSGTIRGRWGITFTNGTDFTLTSPDGTATNGSFSEATAAEFDGPMYVYAGVVPNSDARRYLSATISRIQLEGFPVPVDDAFVSTVLDPAWQFSGVVPAAVVPIVAAENPLWLSWTLPAPGYTLQYSHSMEEFGWLSYPDTSAFNSGSSRYLLINQSALPDLPGRAFFRLYKP